MVSDGVSVSVAVTVALGRGGVGVAVGARALALGCEGVTVSRGVSEGVAAEEGEKLGVVLAQLLMLKDARGVAVGWGEAVKDMVSVARGVEKVERVALGVAVPACSSPLGEAERVPPAAAAPGEALPVPVAPMRGLEVGAAGEGVGVRVPPTRPPSSDAVGAAGVALLAPVGESVDVGQALGGVLREAEVLGEGEMEGVGVAKGLWEALAEVQEVEDALTPLDSVGETLALLHTVGVPVSAALAVARVAVGEAEKRREVDMLWLAVALLLPPAILAVAGAEAVAPDKGDAVWRVEAVPTGEKLRVVEGVLLPPAAPAEDTVGDGEGVEAEKGEALELGVAAAPVGVAAALVVLLMPALALGAEEAVPGTREALAVPVSPAPPAGERVGECVKEG